MRKLLQALSWLGLVGTLLPAALHLFGLVALDDVKTLMLVSAILWFVTTPVWMERKR